MSKPPFVMSKYATREALLSDAANYYEAECDTLRAAIQTQAEEAAKLMAQRDELLTLVEAAELEANYARADTNDARHELLAVKRAARYIHNRPGIVSGSFQMAEGDALCEAVGLHVWTWPIPSTNLTTKEPQ